MKERALKYSSFVFIGLGVLAVLDGLFLVFADKFALFLPEDVRYVGMTAHEIYAFNPSLYDWAVIVYRLWGGFMFTAGMFTVTVARQLYMKKEKWAWYTLALALCPTLVLWIVVNIPVPSYFLPELWAVLVIYLGSLFGSFWAVFI